MTQSPRPLRVGDQIQIELSDILRRKFKDPRLGFVTITRVDVTPDLRQASVYVSVLEGEGFTILEGAKGFLRSELGRRIKLRHVPDLIFREDHSAEKARRVEELLRDLEDERNRRPAPEEPGDDE